LAGSWVGGEVKTELVGDVQAVGRGDLLIIEIILVDRTGMVAYLKIFGDIIMSFGDQVEPFIGIGQIRDRKGPAGVGVPQEGTLLVFLRELVGCTSRLAEPRRLILG